jgi:hypothetical protein
VNHHEHHLTTAAADLTAGLRRLAPELLVTQDPTLGVEDLLHTLVEAELTARDGSKARNQMWAATLSVVKALPSST